MIKRLLIIILYLNYLSVTPVAAIERNISNLVSFEIRNDIYTPGNYSFASNLKFDFKVFNNLNFILGLTADNYEIEVGEIFARLPLHDYLHIQIGEFDNVLSLDGYLLPQNHIFAKNSLISTLIEKQGYISSSIGLMLYKPYLRNTLPISYFIHALWLPSHSEGQFDLGFFYHFSGENSYLGLLGCYFPFMAHYNWIGERSGTKLHNYTINLIWSNYDNNFVYGSELSFGSNLIDPISLVEYPVDVDRSFFLGGDIHLGYSFIFDKLNWLPAIRYSVVFTEVKIMESYLQEIKIGNRLIYKDKLYLNIDTGIGINTKYISDILYTGLEFLWALKLSIVF